MSNLNDKTEEELKELIDNTLNEQGKLRILHKLRTMRKKRDVKQPTLTRKRLVTFNNLTKRKESYPVQISFPLKEESTKKYKKNTTATVSSSSDNAEVSVVFDKLMGKEEPPRLRAEFYKISGLKNNVYEIPLPNPGNNPPEKYEKVEGKDSQKTTRITHEFSSGRTPLFSVTYSADIYIDLTNHRPFVWYLNIKDHKAIINRAIAVKTNLNQKGETEINIKEERVFKGIPIYILDNNLEAPAAGMLWNDV